MVMNFNNDTEREEYQRDNSLLEDRIALLRELRELEEGNYEEA